jgi:hypothetical protein
VLADPMVSLATLSVRVDVHDHAAQVRQVVQELVLCQGNLRGTVSENGLYVVYAPTGLVGTYGDITFPSFEPPSPCLTGFVFRWMLTASGGM